MKYETKTEPLGELLLSDVVFGYNQAFLQSKDTLTFPEMLKYLNKWHNRKSVQGDIVVLNGW